MKRDQLYLLKAGFEDKGRKYYCPSCAELVGLLEFYPALKSQVELHYVDFPRSQLVERVTSGANGSHRSEPDAIIAGSTATAGLAG